MFESNGTWVGIVDRDLRLEGKLEFQFKGMTG